MVGLFLGLLVCGAIAAAARTPVQETEPAATPITIPDINLEGLEPEIAEQLGALRLAANTALQAGKVETSADAVADLARHYHAYDFLDAAAAAYEAALELRLEETSAYLLALVHRERGDLEQALHLFSVIASRQPKYVAARYYQALTLFDMGQFDSSRATVPEDTDSPAFLVLLGRLALEADRPEIAAPYFASAIEKAPDANRTYYLLAQAYRAAGEREKASAALEQYGPVGVRPSDPLMDGIRELRVGSTPFTLSGRRAFAAGRFEEAVDLFRKALAARPQDAGLMINLASALAQTDALEEPIALLEAALALDAESSVAQFNLGVLFVKAGKPGQAVGPLSAAVALTPGDAVARAELVKALARLGRIAEALQALVPLHGTAQHNESLRLLEVRLLVGSKDFDGASKRIEEALAALPASGLVASAAARFYASVPSLAHRDGSRAMELASLVFEATGAPADAVTVGLALGELGRCTKAAEWMATANAALSNGGQLSEDARRFWQRAQQGSDCRPRGQ